MITEYRGIRVIDQPKSQDWALMVRELDVHVRERSVLLNNALRNMALDFQNAMARQNALLGQYMARQNALSGQYMAGQNAVQAAQLQYWNGYLGLDGPGGSQAGPSWIGWLGRYR